MCVPCAGDAIALKYGMRADWRSVCDVGLPTEVPGDSFTVDISDSVFLNNSCAGDGAPHPSLACRCT